MTDSPDPASPDAEAPRPAPARGGRGFEPALAGVSLAFRLAAWALTGSMAVLVWLLDGVLETGGRLAERRAAGSARWAVLIGPLRAGMAIGAVGLVGIWALLGIVWPRPVVFNLLGLILAAVALGIAGWRTWRERGGDVGVVARVSDLGPLILVVIGLSSGAVLRAPGLDAAAALVLAIGVVWQAVAEVRALARTPDATVR